MKKVYKIMIVFMIILGVFITGVHAITNSTGNTRSAVQANETTNEIVAGESETQINSANAQTEGTDEETEEQKSEIKSENSKGLGLIAAALSTGLACLGAGIAVAIVASSAVGAISENPGLLGKTIIFVGLAEGIAIYGLIISIMILNQI